MSNQTPETLQEEFVRLREIAAGLPAPDHLQEAWSIDRAPLPVERLHRLAIEQEDARTQEQEVAEHAYNSYEKREHLAFKVASVGLFSTGVVAGIESGNVEPGVIAGAGGAAFFYTYGKFVIASSRSRVRRNFGLKT